MISFDSIESQRISVPRKTVHNSVALSLHTYILAVSCYLIGNKIPCSSHPPESQVLSDVSLEQSNPLVQGSDRVATITANKISL